MRFLMYLIFCLVTVSGVGAQPTPSLLAGESVFVCASNTTLVTGETLRYSVFCMNTDEKKLSAISKIAYVRLVDHTRKTVASQKITLENGVGNGDFFVPTTLATGSYKLIVYTRWMLNASLANYFEADIAIINPFVALVPDDVPPNTSLQWIKPDAQSIIATDKPLYGHREKVTLHLDLPSAGNYTVSVRKKDSLSLPAQSANRFSAQTPLNAMVSADGIRLWPELRGELLSGRIVSSTRPVKDQGVALSISGKDFGFKLVDTDVQGRFMFVLDATPLMADAVIQVLTEHPDDFRIELDHPIEPDLSRLTFPKIRWESDQKQRIEERMTAGQIESAYYGYKKDSILAPRGKSTFFSPLQKDYVLDDYTRFPTLKETIIEVLVEMAIQKNKNRYRIVLRNHLDDLSVYGAPLVLVDGLLVQDTHLLFNYPMGEIEKVGLINQPYVYGPKTFGGVVSFRTKKQDFNLVPKYESVKKIVLDRPVSAKKMFAPQYESNPTSRIPDYREQLLWQNLNSDARQPIEFYTADTHGTFEINVQGFATDGPPVSATATFQVN